MQRLSPVCPLLMLVLLSCLAASPATAQSQRTPPAPEHDHAAMLADQEHDHAAMMAGVTSEGSGTAWLPGTAPMYEFHGAAAGWSLMAHGNLFVQYLDESGARGGHQAGSINWFMVRGQHAAGAGRVGFSAMASLEPWTIRGCGYPDLLASGESCGGEAIHDRQHPHDLLMELAASYDRPLKGALRWHLYGGPAGEPALGPVFPIARRLW